MGEGSFPNFAQTFFLMPQLLLHSYPYLTAESPDSFARLTLTQRVPRFLDDVLAADNWNEEQRTAILELKEEILHNRPIKTLDLSPGLARGWEAFFEQWGSTPWFELPFLHAEIYLYERLLSDLGYHQSRVKDPFFAQKHAPLTEHVDHLQKKWAAVQKWPSQLAPEACLKQGMALALGGNQADLSQVQLAAQPDVRQDLSQDKLLIDQRKAAIELILTHEKPTIHYLLDNAGLELMHDMMFIWLLRQVGADVIIHPKEQPIFVSDVTLPDWMETNSFLHKHIPSMAEALNENGQTFMFNDFWTFPLSFYDWPKKLIEAFSKATLIISKGDANYRRILGDRQISPTEDPAPLTRYLPAPLLAIRTLKSEIQVGLSPGKLQQVQSEDPDWMVNGKWGVFQLFMGQ